VESGHLSQPQWFQIKTLWSLSTAKPLVLPLPHLMKRSQKMWSVVASSTKSSWHTSSAGSACVYATTVHGTMEPFAPQFHQPPHWYHGTISFRSIGIVLHSGLLQGEHSFCHTREHMISLWHCSALPREIRRHLLLTLLHSRLVPLVPQYQRSHASVILHFKLLIGFSVCVHCLWSNRAQSIVVKSGSNDWEREIMWSNNVSWLLNLSSLLRWCVQTLLNTFKFSYSCFIISSRILEVFYLFSKHCKNVMLGFVFDMIYMSSWSVIISCLWEWPLNCCRFWSSWCFLCTLCCFASMCRYLERCFSSWLYIFTLFSLWCRLYWVWDYLRWCSWQSIFSISPNFLLVLYLFLIFHWSFCFHYPYLI